MKRFDMIRIIPDNFIEEMDANMANNAEAFFGDEGNAPAYGTYAGYKALCSYACGRWIIMDTASKAYYAMVAVKYGYGYGHAAPAPDYEEQAMTTAESEELVRLQALKLRLEWEKGIAPTSEVRFPSPSLETVFLLKSTERL